MTKDEAVKVAYDQLMNEAEDSPSVSQILDTLSLECYKQGVIDGKNLQLKLGSDMMKLVEDAICGQPNKFVSQPIASDFKEGTAL